MSRLHPVSYGAGVLLLPEWCCPVPPDDRVDFNDRIFAPIEGTPLPPGAVAGGTPTDPLAAM